MAPRAGALATGAVGCYVRCRERLYMHGGLTGWWEGLGVAAEAYFEATIDPICEVAPKLIKWMNSEYSDQLSLCVP